MLDMFPLLDGDKEREQEKWELLSTMEEPAWTVPRDKNR